MRMHVSGTAKMRITYGDATIEDDGSTFQENGVGENSKLSVQMAWREFDASNVQVRYCGWPKPMPLMPDLVGSGGAPEVCVMSGGAGGWQAGIVLYGSECEGMGLMAVWTALLGCF